MTRPLNALVAMTVSVGASASAYAQSVCNLPERTIAARSVADIDSGAINACLEANVPGLSGDYDTIRQARQAILTPLRASDVSLTFRLSYSDALRQRLSPLVRNANVDIALNALRIAGELGTTDGANICIQALEDQRAAVRMMAVSGLARTFGILQTTATIQPQQFSAIEGRLSQALKNEQDPEVLDGFAMAYEAAMQIPENLVADARNIALRSAATRFGEITRAKEMNGEKIPALLRASNATLTTLRGLVGNRPPNDALIESAGFGGDLLAYTLRRLRSGEVNETERAQLAVLVGQAQNLVSVTFALVGGQGSKSYRLDALGRESNDQQFYRDVLNVVGGEGDLVKAPFNLPRNRFIPAP